MCVSRLLLITANPLTTNIVGWRRALRTLALCPTYISTVININNRYLCTAYKITSAPACGWESIGTWLDFSSVVLAFARVAIERVTAGASIWPAVGTMYQLGLVCKCIMITEFFLSAIPSPQFSNTHFHLSQNLSDLQKYCHAPLVLTLQQHS